MPRHPAPALGWQDGQLEALKWLALGSMALDHVGRFLLGFPQDSWVFAGGRLAFPLFAFVLGLNLARDGDLPARARRTALRLALWCAVAVLPSVAMRGDPRVLNVLGTLALGALACWALAAQAPPVLRATALAAAAVGGLGVEFGVAGVLLTPAVFLLARRPGALEALAVAAALGLVAWGNARFGGPPAAALTLVAPALALLVRRLPVAMPRWQWAFYLAYPLHMAVIAALRSAG